MGKTRRKSEKRVQEGCHRVQSKDKVTVAQKKMAAGSYFCKKHFKLWSQQSIQPHRALIKESAMEKQ